MFNNLPYEMQEEILIKVPNFRTLSTLYRNNSNYRFVNHYCNQYIDKKEALKYINLYNPTDFYIFYMTKDDQYQNQFNIDYYFNNQVQSVILYYNKIDQDTFNIVLEYQKLKKATTLPFNDLIFDNETMVKIFNQRLNCCQLIDNYAINFTNFIYKSLSKDIEVNDIDSFFHSLCHLLYKRINLKLNLPHVNEFNHIIFDYNGAPLNNNYLSLLEKYKI